jgi:hypothetical protein
VTEKKKVVSERVYTDGVLDSRVLTITRWTEKPSKLEIPVPVKGFTEERSDKHNE